MVTCIARECNNLCLNSFKKVKFVSNKRSYHMGVKILLNLINVFVTGCDIMCFIVSINLKICIFKTYSFQDQIDVNILD